MTIVLRSLVWSVVVTLAVASSAHAQPADTAAITQFQRVVDAYAFQHRQIQRRVGDTPDQAAMSTAVRMAKAIPEEGTLFTPLIGAAFRARIAAAVQHGCLQPVTASAVVPRGAEDAGGAPPVAACVTASLPRLPEELAYRIAGVALVLVDVHANLVVDVLHAAFPPRAAQ